MGVFAINRWRERNKEKLREYGKNPEVRKKRAAEWKARYWIVIPFHTKCWHCKKRWATQRHHKDYDKPLVVEFVCAKCHRDITFKNSR